MSSLTKNVLFVNLYKKEFEVKSFSELWEYIGGVGIGIKLLDLLYDNKHDKSDPIIFSIGPLTGFFPFASKTSVVLRQDGVIEDLYMGGTLSARLKFTGLDSIVIFGASKEPVFLEITDDNVIFHSSFSDSDEMGLPGKRSYLMFQDEKVMLDKYFTVPEDFLTTKFKEKNLLGLVVTGTKTFEPTDWDRYNSLYSELLQKTASMKVHKGEFPSCTGCPMGCSPSYSGEIGGNILVHSLVGCGYAENIFSDIGTVFSCLNVLGYDYTHEDIENLPDLVSTILKNY